MNLRLIALSLLAICGTAVADLSSSIEKLRAVGREGAGNEAATSAWQELARQDAVVLVQVLAGMNGANPLAENWLRTAAGVIADNAVAAGKPLPLADLKAFLRDTKNTSEPRVLAFDLISRASKEEAEQITATLLDDPSADLRRYPVAKLIAEGEAKLAAKDQTAAAAAFMKALSGARDEDQIKSLAKLLKDMNKTVDLPAHFGFLMKWHLIAPFTNVDRKGFDEVFPPEREINLAAAYPGKGKEARWVEFTSKDDYGMIDFNKPFGMEKQVTGYAFTEFQSASERDAEIRLGCKNGWKVWLNGKLVFGRDEYHRGMKLDQYKLRVRLKKGANTILVKCCQNEQTEQWTVEWQFQLRICDATGTALLAKAEN